MRSSLSAGEGLLDGARQQLTTAAATNGLGTNLNTKYTSINTSLK
jgi:hypothetical protein